MGVFQTEDLRNMTTKCSKRFSTGSFAITDIIGQLEKLEKDLRMIMIVMRC